MVGEGAWRGWLEGYSVLELADLIERCGKDSELGRLADEVLAGKVEARRWQQRGGRGCQPGLHIRPDSGGDPR